MISRTRNLLRIFIDNLEEIDAEVDKLKVFSRLFRLVSVFTQYLVEVGAGGGVFWLLAIRCHLCTST